MRNILALHHHLLHGVPLDRANHLLLVVTLLGEVLNEDFSEFKRMTLTGREVYLYDIAIDTIEQRFYSFLTYQLAGNMEA